VAGFAENLGEGLTQIGIIFNDQHGGFIHGSAPSIT
jgi:hypothetical protein